jgi:hypothetical protein
MRGGTELRLGNRAEVTVGVRDRLPIARAWREGGFYRNWVKLGPRRRIGHFAMLGPFLMASVPPTTHPSQSPMVAMLSMARPSVDVMLPTERRITAGDASDAFARLNGP